MRVIDISANNALFPRNTESEVILRTSKDFTIILDLFPFDKYYWLYYVKKRFPCIILFTSFTSCILSRFVIIFAHINSFDV